jgi:hypothetical protein
MNDDWRLQIDLEDKGAVEATADHLRAADLEQDLAHNLDRDVIVSHEGETIYLYAADREPLDVSRRVVQEFFDSKGWQGRLQLRHWHKEAEEWEDPAVPEPTTPAEKEAEHERLMKTEDEETAARGGRAEFEVSAKFPTSHEAHAFAEKLKTEGYKPIRRFRYLVVGANDEDEAKELAERIRAEAPSDAEVKAEYSLNQLWRERPPNSFFWLGGLGG